MLQLELVGLSRLGTNPLQVLKDNIPGYRLLRDRRSASRARPSMTDSFAAFDCPGLALAIGLCAARRALLQAQRAVPAPHGRTAAGLNGDYIVAVVNSELVTAGEVEQRLSAPCGEPRAVRRCRRAEQLRQQALDR